MGNCLRHDSSTSWGGDDWGILTSSTNDDDEYGFYGTEFKALLENHRKFDLGTTSSSSSTREVVKVKITKKQMEELFGKVDLKELSVQQVLEKLINVSNQYEANQRSWRPALQSIPEV